MNKMRLWRSKKMSQEAGRQTQVCVWAPEEDAELIREMCVRIAEPSERGRALRSTLQPQLDRRRTTAAVWSAFAWQAEIDYPLAGPWWFKRNIGGRVIGPDGTHIELSPKQANELKDRLSHACARIIEHWVEEEKLNGAVRDHAGVLMVPPAVRADRDCDVRRPTNDAEFAANEARLARSIYDAAIASRKPTIVEPSIIEYEGAWGFPSFCQIAHRKHEGRVQFALIHMPNGGTSPTNMVASLATFMRQSFYSRVDPGLIDWFDVIPAKTYGDFPSALVIHAVTLEHANGIYSNPSWSGTDKALLGDWRDFIQETIAHGQKEREQAKTASQDEGTNVE
jgi:hypothetical protein